MPMPRSLGSSQVTFLLPMMIWPSETSSRPAMQLRAGSTCSASGRPEQHQELALPDIEVEVLDHLHRAEAERQISDGNAGLHSLTPFTAPAAMPRTNHLPETK